MEFEKLFLFRNVLQIYYYSFNNNKVTHSQNSSESSYNTKVEMIVE